MKLLSGAFAAGLIFGIGLLVAGMTDPAKVLGFLDIAGAWDPSLALVMVGAIAVARVGVVMAATQARTLASLKYPVSASSVSALPSSSGNAPSLPSIGCSCFGSRFLICRCFIKAAF